MRDAQDLAARQSAVATARVFFATVWGMTVRCLLPLLVLCASVQAKEDSVARFAGSWDDAVEEAKILNVPIVVHNQCLT